MTEIGIPSFLTLTCPECCEDSQAFMATDGDKDRLYAEYSCQNCDHRVLLDLDP
jgi:DNA-directed RNA polymerase subunit RPC12/RpoP